MKPRLTEHLKGGGLVERQAAQGGFVIPASATTGKTEALRKLAAEHPGQVIFLDGPHIPSSKPVKALDLMNTTLGRFMLQAAQLGSYYHMAQLQFESLSHVFKLYAAKRLEVRGWYADRRANEASMHGENYVIHNTQAL